MLTEALDYKTSMTTEPNTARESKEAGKGEQKGRQKFPVDEGGGEIAVCCAIKHTPQRDKPRLISSPAIFQLQEVAAREVGERRREDYKDIWALILKGGEN